MKEVVKVLLSTFLIAAGVAGSAAFIGMVGYTIVYGPLALRLLEGFLLVWLAVLTFTKPKR
jgi:hypothetical protein